MTTHDDTLALLMVDPATLVIGDNVRDQVDLDQTPDFVESVAEHGVLHPILAERRGDGTIVVLDGQRRTLAARAAHRPAVPVVVRDRESETETDRATRIGEQILSNDQRVALTNGQRTAGIATMLELGLSVAAVAKAASVPRSKVKTLGTVGASATARASMDDHQLTLEQAAVIAEFEAEGDTDGIERLLGHRPHNFDYMAQRLRINREERLAQAAAEAPYRAKGFTIQHHYIWNAVTHEDVLNDAGEPITLEDVEADPSRWGVALSCTESWFDRETGEELAEDDIDWETHEDPELEAQEGLRHAKTVETRRVWDREFHLLAPDDLEGSGLRLSETAQAIRNRRTGRTTTPVSLSAEQEAERKERERQERRRVRELNKRADAAATVRRAFLKTLLASKKPPIGACAWIATTLASQPQLLGDYHATKHLAELLGIKALDTRGEVRDMASSANETRAQVITFALVAAAMESRIPRDAWRGGVRGADEYFELLAANGHELSDVEKVIAGHESADSVAID